VTVSGGGDSVVCSGVGVSDWAIAGVVSSPLITSIGLSGSDRLTREVGRFIGVDVITSQLHGGLLT